MNRNNSLELDELHTLCDDLHIGLGMSMSLFTPEALKASVARFSGGDKLSAGEFHLWFAEALKESIEAHQRLEEQAAVVLPFKVRSEDKLASIKAPLDVSMQDVIEAVAAVLELPSANTCLLHGDKQLPSGETPLAEVGLSEQSELTAIVVGQ